MTLAHEVPPYTYAQRPWARRCAKWRRQWLRRTAVPVTPAPTPPACAPPQEPAEMRYSKKIPNVVLRAVEVGNRTTKAVVLFVGNGLPKAERKKGLYDRVDAELRALEQAGRIKATEQGWAYVS